MQLTVTRPQRKKINKRKSSGKAEINKPEKETVTFNPKTAFKPEEAYTSDFSEERSKIVSFDSNEDL